MFKHTFKDAKKEVAATIYARDDDDAATVAFSGKENTFLVILHRFNTLDEAIEAAAEFCDLDIAALQKHINPRGAVPF